MYKEINIPFKLYVNKCKNTECGMNYSVIAHIENGNTWIHQSPDYCPYCSKAIDKESKDLAKILIAQKE